MRFEIVTIFPGFFASIFENGILRRALAEGLVEVGIHDLRAFTHDRHRTVDDRPFGGGEGMVLKPEPIAAALASIGVEPKFTEASQENSARPTVILLSAQGRPFTQSWPAKSPPSTASFSSAAAMRAWTSASTSSTATWSFPSATTSSAEANWLPRW